MNVQQGRSPRRKSRWCALIPNLFAPLQSCASACSRGTYRWLHAGSHLLQSSDLCARPKRLLYLRNKSRRFFARTGEDVNYGGATSRAARLCSLWCRRYSRCSGIRVCACMCCWLLSWERSERSCVCQCVRILGCVGGDLSVHTCVRGPCKMLPQ